MLVLLIKLILCIQLFPAVVPPGTWGMVCLRGQFSKPLVAVEGQILMCAVPRCHQESINNFTEFPDLLFVFSLLSAVCCSGLPLLVHQPENWGFIYPALGCRLLGQSTRRAESGKSSGVYCTIGTITSPKGEQKFLPSEVQVPWGSYCCHCACQALRHQRTAWGPELMRRDEHTGESPFSLSVGDHFPSLGAGFRGSLLEHTLSMLWLSAGSGCIEFRTGKQVANLAPVWWFCEFWPSCTLHLLHFTSQLLCAFWPGCIVR